MRRSRAETGTITGIAEATAERVGLSGEILKAMAEAMAANEKLQRRFRNAVLIRLTRIETVVQMVHGAQINEASRPGHPGSDEKAAQLTKMAEQFAEQHSDELGLSMIKYIYQGGV